MNHCHDSCRILSDRIRFCKKIKNEDLQSESCLFISDFAWSCFHYVITKIIIRTLNHINFRRGDQWPKSARNCALDNATKCTIWLVLSVSVRTSKVLHIDDFYMIFQSKSIITGSQLVCLRGSPPQYHRTPPLKKVFFEFYF